MKTKRKAGNIPSALVLCVYEIRELCFHALPDYHCVFKVSVKSQHVDNFTLFFLYFDGFPNERVVRWVRQQKYDDINQS